MRHTGESLEDAWNALDARWDDEAAHRRFLAFCVAQGALPEAGRRYRELAERDLLRRERAQRGLTAVQGAAWLHLEATRTAAPRPRSRVKWAVGGVCLVLLGYGILSVLRLLAR